MKKLALALAIATAPFVATVAQADDGKPQVYGRINLAFQHVDETDLKSGLDGKTELRSNSSRIGVKGSQKIDDNVTAIYQLEFRINPDSLDGGDGSHMKHRNSFVGFKTNYGIVKFGTHDTPLKLIQDKIDVFGGLDGDIKEVISANGENRAENMLMYTSPSMGGVVIDVAHISTESTGVDNKDDDGISASVTYSADKLFLGVAYDDNVKDQDISTLRASARVDVGSLQLGAIFEETDDDGVKEDGWMVSAAYKVAAKTSLKAQYGQSDQKYIDGETLSLGVDYQYAKSTRLYAFSTTNSGDKGTKNESASYNGVGIEYRF